MSFWSEFKAFAVKGNVIDMAVGVVIGTAFSKVVSSLVSDIIMPIVSIFTDSISFAEWKVVLRPATATEPAVTLNYGLFIDTIVNLLIIALSIFMAIKLITRAKDLAEETVNSVIPADFSLDKLESMIIGDNKENTSTAQLSNQSTTESDGTDVATATPATSSTQTSEQDSSMQQSGETPVQNLEIATQQLVLLTQIRDLLNKQLNPTSSTSRSTPSGENQDKPTSKL